MLDSTEVSGSKIRRDTVRTGSAPLLLWLAALAVLAAGLLFGSGCSKRGEPKITGSRSAAAVSLACAWQSGHAYHLRLDTEILTESENADPHNPNLHRVTFAQECLIKVTNALRGDNFDFDLEILSLEMERAKGEAIALSFNSEQGGENIDEHGYIPVLKRLVGGHLRGAVSPDGKTVRIDGLGEWLDRALGSAPATRPPVSAPRLASLFKRSGPGAPTNAPASVVLDDTTGLPLPPPGIDLSSSNPPNAIIKKSIRNVATTSSGASVRMSTSSGNDNVGRTLRSFFTADHFRQLLEFHFLPPGPVRVGDEWTTQGDTPITGRGRVRYDAKGKFTGWQENRVTNCARIDVHGKLGAKVSQETAAAQKKTSIGGTLWINTVLGFPSTTVLDKAALFPGDTNTRRDGTNSVTTTGAAKLIRQRTAITLLKVTSLDAPASDLKSSL